MVICMPIRADTVSPTNPIGLAKELRCVNAIRYSKYDRFVRSDGPARSGSGFEGADIIGWSARSGVSLEVIDDLRQPESGVDGG